MTNALQAVILKIRDGYGYDHDESGDGATYGIQKLRCRTGYHDVQHNKGLAPPGELELTMNNQSKHYTPSLTPGYKDIAVLDRKVSLAFNAPSLGYICRLDSSGQGGPGTYININTARTHTSGFGGTSNPYFWLIQQFITNGGRFSGFTMDLTNGSAPIGWWLYGDANNSPDLSVVLASGSFTSVANLNTISVANGPIFPYGTKLWISIGVTSNFNVNIYDSNGVSIYAGLSGSGSSGSLGTLPASYTTSANNLRMSITMAPAGTIIQQTVNVSGNSGDTLAATIDARGQYDAQYNLFSVQIITNAEKGAPSIYSLTNKYKNYSGSLVATANYTSITLIVCAAHNASPINSIYTEVRNATLTKNAGANLLSNGNFASNTLLPWTESSQTDVSIYDKTNYDTDVALRAGSGAGTSITQNTSPNTIAVGFLNSSNNQGVAQTITPSATGILSQLTFGFGQNIGNPIGNMTYEIWSTKATGPGIGYYNNSKLFTGTFAPLPGSSNVPISVLNGPILYANTVYMILIYATLFQSSDNAWQVTNSSSDVYAGGKLGTWLLGGSVGGKSSSYFGAIPTDTGFDLTFTLTSNSFPIKDKLAESLVVFRGQTIASCKLWMAKVGSPAGTDTLRIETDSNGSPSGTLANVNATATLAESGLATTYGWATFTFAGSFTLNVEQVYWLVLSTSRASDASNYVIWGSNAGNPTYLNGAGSMMYQASSVYTAENKNAIFDLIGSSFTYAAVTLDTVKRFEGTIETIEPDAHLFGELKATIKCKDWTQQLQNIQFNLPVQVNQTDGQLVSTLMGLFISGSLTLTPSGFLTDVGTTTFPWSLDGYVTNKTSIDPGNTYVYALAGEIIRANQNKMMLQQALDDVLKSAFGRFWQDSDGTLRYANRNQTPNLQSVAPVLTIVEGQAGSPGSPVMLMSSLDIALRVNHCYVNYHPRQVGSSNIVLAQVNIPPNTNLVQFLIPPRTFDEKSNATIPGKLQLTMTMRDSAGKPIGTTSLAVPVADTDFQFQWTQWGTQPAGSAYDITRPAVWPVPWNGIVTFSYTFTASQIIVTILNWSSHPLFVAKFQFQGIPLYTLDPVTIELVDAAVTNNKAMNHPLTIDQPFANDRHFAESLASYILLRYNTDGYLKGNKLSFKNVWTVNGFDLILANIFDKVSIPDTQSGFTGATQHFIVGSEIKMETGQGGYFDIDYILERVDPNLYVKYDDANVGTFDGVGLYYI